MLPLAFEGLPLFGLVVRAGCRGELLDDDEFDE